MADETIAIRVRMIGGSAVVTEAKAVSGAVAGTGSTAAAATRSQSKFRSGIGALGRTIRYSAIPLLGGLAYETIRSVNAYREARKVGEQTNAVIKSTGGIANATADDIAKLSSSLSLKTGVDDEEIQAATNMLLTFTKIRNEAGKNNDILDQTTEATLDLASATKTDMVSAAKQLGKALNDPTTGLTALRRSGASFNTEQTETIQKLFESGKRLKAQKMILRELSTEFAGSARAQHDSVDRLGVAWENLEEKLGEFLYPVLQDVTRWLTRSLRQAERGEGPLIDLKNAFVTVGKAIEVALIPLKAFIDAIKWLEDHWDTIKSVGAGGALVDASQFMPERPPHVNADAAGEAPHPGGPGPAHKVRRAALAEPQKSDTSSGHKKGGAPKVIHNHIHVGAKEVAKQILKVADDDLALA